MQTAEPWYSVKCIFQHETLAQQEGEAVYEERIIVLRANNLDEAIVAGEAEAKAYAADGSTIRYTGFINAFHIYAMELVDGAEVYSLMRNTTLDTDAFLDYYYDDGTERVQHYTSEVEGSR